MADAGFGESLNGHWRRERGWDLSIGRSGISFRSYCYFDRVAAPVGQMHGQAARPLRRLAWLAPLVAGGTLAATVLAAPIRAEGGVSTLTMPIPAPAMRVARSPLVSPIRHAHVAVRRASRTETRAVPTVEPAIEADTPALSSESDAAMEQRYVALAMRTGEVQSWQTDSARYFLVAGDAQPGDAQVCRQFSLLARGGAGGDTVEHFERCRPS